MRRMPKPSLATKLLSATSWSNGRGPKASPMASLRQSLAHQPSAFLSQADAAVPNIEQKPPVLDSVFHRHKQ
jgi:hypothetical protein